MSALLNSLNKLRPQEFRSTCDDATCFRSQVNAFHQVACLIFQQVVELAVELLRSAQPFELFPLEYTHMHDRHSFDASIQRRALRCSSSTIKFDVWESSLKDCRRQRKLGGQLSFGIAVLWPSAFHGRFDCTRTNNPVKRCADQDEYAHILVESLCLIGKNVDEIATEVCKAIAYCLKLRTSTAQADVFVAGKRRVSLGDPLRMRTRFAMRFGDQEVEASSVRGRLKPASDGRVKTCHRGAGYVD